jgi:hypothetical protein
MRALSVETVREMDLKDVMTAILSRGMAVRPLVLWRVASYAQVDLAPPRIHVLKRAETAREQEMNSVMTAILSGGMDVLSLALLSLVSPALEDLALRRILARPLVETV